MQTTFGFIGSNKTHIVAAASALGREQVIPGMFRALLADMNIGKKAPLFHYYLERHIHLDDELHGPLSLKLLGICAAAAMRKVRAASKAGREPRHAWPLWDGVARCPAFLLEKTEQMMQWEIVIGLHCPALDQHQDLPALRPHCTAEPEMR